MKFLSLRSVGLGAIAVILSFAGGAGAACPVGDLHEDVDCQVNWLDLRDFAEHWLNGACSSPVCSADLDGVPGVTLRDFARLAEHWLETRSTTLLINEFMADNEGTIEDPEEPGEYPDWIEIYNYGRVAIDMGGMYITDRPLDESRWGAIPTGFPEYTTIEPGGYLVFWADDDTEQGPRHLNFKISADGSEDIGLFDWDKNELDVVGFDAKGDDESRGRVPDGGGNWVDFEVGGATPGGRNRGSTVDIVINEIMYHPEHEYDPRFNREGGENTGMEWIELYNNGSAPVNLGGWRFIDGIDFVIPDGVVLDIGEYVVVASDVNEFRVQYPDANNFIGGWDGRLSNSGEEIELVDDAGILVDRVRYCDEGEWAVRRLGAVDYYHRGWEWSDAHDGDGKSLELINPRLSNMCGQNWAAAEGDDCTPGEINSVWDDDIAPLILDVEHLPIIPGPNDPVTVTARIVDEFAAAFSVTLHYRRDYSEPVRGEPRYDPNFRAIPMFDDGANKDGSAGDGVFGGQIPSQHHLAVVEFYIETRDSGGNTRTWPASSLIDGAFEQVNNALYQVDGSFDPAGWIVGSQPVYRLIMTEAQRGELLDMSRGSYPERESNAQMNVTFVSVNGTDTKVRHNAGIRVRGHGSRRMPPVNWRVNFTHDRPWQDVTSINLNTKYTYLQVVGNALFRSAGFVAPAGDPVQVFLNGENRANSGYEMYGSFVHMEVINSDFVNRHLPDDGNVYKCMRSDTNYSDTADLRYRGQDPRYYHENYLKRTNAAADDFNDIMDLTYALSEYTSDANFIEEVTRVANVDEWLRFLAMGTLLNSKETSISTGDGDDYYLYRGVEDPRFILVPHDLDTILGQGRPGSNPTDGIFQFVGGRYGGMPGLERLVLHPEHIGDYYGHLRDLIETTFSRERFDPLIASLIGGFVPGSTIQQMTHYIAQRIAHVLSLIPSELTIANIPMFENYYITQSANVSLAGQSDAVNTRSVTVNGQEAAWEAVEGVWHISDLLMDPGINRVIVEAFDEPNGAGRKIDEDYIDVWYDTGRTSEISGVMGTRFLLAALGPWHVTGDINVPSGATLFVQAGATLFFDAGAGITVESGGKLVAQGSEYNRIRFTRVPGGGNWDGVKFDGTVEDNQLAYLDQEYGDEQGCSTDVRHSRVTIDNVTWDRTDKRVLNLEHARVICRNSEFPSIVGGEAVEGMGLGGDEYAVFDGCTFAAASGGNDVIRFSGGRRPGPILQLYDCTFLGGGNDGVDLSGADAHIEGSMFGGFANGEDGDANSATANAIAAGGESEVVVARNVFAGGDHHVTLRDGASVTVQNNVFVGAAFSSVNFGEPGSGAAPGAGAYLEGNVFLDNAAIFHNLHNNPNFPGYGPEDMPVVNSSMLPLEWHHLGSGNIAGDPLFVDTGGGDFNLKPDSGAIGAGPGGLDMGAMVAPVAAISGEPSAKTYRRSATLRVGGPGITRYKYSVNSPTGPWSGEMSVDVPIELTGLSNGGSYTVYAYGMNSAGVWSSEDNATASRTWTVDTSHSDLLINEVLAHTLGADPDIIELYYDGPAPVDLAGMSLTDDPADPGKFVFAPSTVSTTTMNPGDYMILYGDLTVAINHVGFALSADGEALYLYDRPAPNGSRNLIDSVAFGPQINDYSIGRVGYDREWKLNTMSFGSENLVQPLGDPDMLLINEWLADGDVSFEEDFVELSNRHSLPVSIGGMYLTDEPMLEPDKHRIAPLSFVPAKGYTVFRANNGNDPSELGFRLSAGGEMIGLFDTDLNMIDRVLYGPQTTDISNGRFPDSSNSFMLFELPTPGLLNVYGRATGDSMNILQGLRITELMYNAPGGSEHDFIELKNVSDVPILLDGVRFVDGIEFEFPAGLLGPGEYIVVAANVTAFRVFYGFGANVAGQYTGGLSGGGEDIVLSLAWPMEAAIMRFDYSDAWYPTTDGLGHSLHINDPTIHRSLWDEAESWHAAMPSPGSP